MFTKHHKTDGNKFSKGTRTAGATKCPQALYAQRLECRVDAGVQKLHPAAPKPIPSKSGILTYIWLF